jgi:hypothetical protein
VDATWSKPPSWQDARRPFEVISQMLDQELPQIRSVTRDPARVEWGAPKRHLYLVPEMPRLPRRDGDSTRHPSIEDNSSDQEPDHLKPFTGVMAAVGLSIPIWITISGLLYYLI